MVNAARSPASARASSGHSPRQAAHLGWGPPLSRRVDIGPSPRASDPRVAFLSTSRYLPKKPPLVLPSPCPLPLPLPLPLPSAPAPDGRGRSEQTGEGEGEGEGEGRNRGECFLGEIAARCFSMMGPETFAFMRADHSTRLGATRSLGFHSDHGALSVYYSSVLRRLPSDCVFGVIASPVGPLHLAVSNGGVHALLFSSQAAMCAEGTFNLRPTHIIPYYCARGGRSLSISRGEGSAASRVLLQALAAASTTARKPPQGHAAVAAAAKIVEQALATASAALRRGAQGRERGAARSPAAQASACARSRASPARRSAPRCAGPW